MADNKYECCTKIITTELTEIFITSVSSAFSVVIILMKVKYKKLRKEN